MSTENRFGPLRFLAGVWEGDDGLDVAFNHATDQVKETPYREKTTLKPFGPVDNGSQHLYGLDYSMAAWRIGEDDPFHTEVGYWLWCADLGHVMKGFVIPRASTILAGGPAGADDAEFSMHSSAGDPEYGIASNPYLLANAKTVTYDVTVTVDGDTFGYTQDSVLDMSNLDDLLHHTDRCTLHRVETLEFPEDD